MKNSLIKISNAINHLNEQVGKATAWLTLFLVVLVCFDVIARKLFNFSQIWIMEMEWHLYALIFLMSAGYALKHDRHVRVDLFYENFSTRDKALTNLWGHLLFMLPWCAIVIWTGWRYGMESFQLNEGSPEPGGLPARYFIKFCIVIAAVLLLLQSIASLIDAGLILSNKKENSVSLQEDA